MNDELLISIGADLSAFNAALNTAENQFKQLQDTIRKGATGRYKQKFIDFSDTAKEFAKEMKKIEDKTEASAKFIKEKMAKALEFGGNSKEWTAEQKAALDRYYKQYLATVKSEEAKATAIKEREAQENADRQIKLADLILKRQLANLKRRNRKAKEAIEEQRALEEKTAKEVADRKAKFDSLILKRQLANLKRRNRKEREEADALVQQQIEAEQRLQRVKDYLFARRLRNYKAEREERKRTLRIEELISKQWGNIERVGHAFRTTLLYGAMAQAIFGVQQAMRAVVDEAIRFNQSVATVGAVLQKSRGEAYLVATAVNDLAVRYGESSSLIEEATLTLGRAGVDAVGDLIAAMESLTALSIITGDTVAEGANAVASILAVYPEYSGNVNELADAMGAVANATRLGLQDFSTISNYALTTAKTIGLTANEYLALSGAMSKVGLNASTIGTSIRRLGKLATDSSNSVQNFFLQIGYSQREFAQDLDKNATQAITNLMNQMSQLSTLELQDILPNEVQMKATLNTLRQIWETGAKGEGANEFIKLLDQIENYEGVAKQADKAALGLGRAITSVQEAVKQAYNQEVDKLFARMFDGVSVRRFNKELKETIETIKDILYWVAQAVVAFGVWKAAMKLQGVLLPLYRNIMQTTKGMDLMFASTVIGTKAFSRLGTVMKAFVRTNPIGLGLVAAFEAWNFITAKQTDDLDKLYEAANDTAEVLNKTKKELDEMTKTQATAEIIRVKKLLQTHKELYETLRQQTGEAIRRRRAEPTNEDYQEEEAFLREKLENNRKSSKELEAYLTTLGHIQDGTREVVDETKEVGTAGEENKKVMDELIAKAYDLANALGVAKNAFYDIRDSIAVSIGKMTEGESVAIKYGRDVATIMKARADILTEIKDKELEIEQAKKRGITAEEDLRPYNNELLKLKADQVKKETELAGILKDKLEYDKQSSVAEIEAQTQAKITAAIQASASKNIKDQAELTKENKRLAAEKYNIELQGLKAQLDITKDVKERDALQARINAKQAQYNKQLQAAGIQSSRDRRDAERSAKAQLDAIKEEQKQKLLLAQIEAGGRNGLSEVETRKYVINSLKEELKAQKKVVAEARAKSDEQVDSEKLKAIAAREYTKQLEIQLKLTEAQRTVWDDILANLKDSISEFSTAFREGGLGGLADSIQGFAEGAIDTLKASGNPYAMAAGYGIDIISGLLSDTLSEAEIAAAKGEVEFTDQSLKNLENVFQSAQYPMLEVTNKMYRHIRSMDTNFVAIARSLVSSTGAGGLDLTGASYIPQMDQTLWGIWGETTSQLLGSGLKFTGKFIGQYLDGIDNEIRGYLTEAVTESSWFGLVEDTDIKTSFQNLDSATRKKFQEVFQSGYTSIVDAAAALGFNRAEIEKQLQAVRLKIGDEYGQISLEGLTESEIADRLSNMFSGIFSSLVDGVAGLEVLTDRYQKQGEESYETLSRIAINYEQAAFQFNLIGKEFTDGITLEGEKLIEVVSSVTTTTSSIFGNWFGLIKTRGALVENGFGDVMSTIVRAMSNTASTITEIVSQSTKYVYTAQMQILDIVESTGGIDKFNDAMASFISNFYTDAEQVEIAAKALEAQFATLGVTMPETKEQFRQLLETWDTSTEQGAYAYGQLLLLSEGFAQMTDAAEGLKGVMEELDLTPIKTIADAWLSDLSYLTNIQKTAFADSYYNMMKELSATNEDVSLVDAAKAAAEQALRTTSTKEEFIPYFERYISALEEEATEATLGDVVVELREVVNAIKEFELNSARTVTDIRATEIVEVRVVP